MKSLLFVIALGIAIGLLLPAGKPAEPVAAGVAAAASPFDSRPSVTRVDRSDGGHFYVDAEVNGQAVRFVVDTGASSVALTMDDARRIGIAFEPSEFNVIGSGASGPVRGKPIILDKVSLDGKEVMKVRGAVLEGLDVSLLGQTYLSRITAVEMHGDYMSLR